MACTGRRSVRLLAWAGSLPALALAAQRSRRDGETTNAMLARYSVLAVPCVVLIVASGTANTLFHAVNAGALIVSLWGRVLAIKLALFAAMLTLAVYLRCKIIPRLGNDTTGSQAGFAATTIAIEATLALLVFGIAALLGLTPPPH